ncbi:Copine protein, putative [Arachis hypogaea]|nr:Copine protein, putative [Arachis hypogaea]
MLSMVIGTNDITRGFLFLGINGVLIHELPLVNSLAFEKRNLLSFGEAFDILPGYPGTQCVLLLLCILMPLYYFAELAHKAAGIAVELGSYKMPLIWFSTLGGLGMALICGSMVLLIVFLSWLYARRRGLQFQGIRMNADVIIGALNA